MDSPEMRVKLILETIKVLQEFTWIQGYIALDLHNTVCGPTDPELKCLCLAGAIQLAAVRLLKVDEREVINYGLIEGVRDVIRATTHDATLSGWNDAPGRTKEEVIEMLTIASIKAMNMGTTHDDLNDDSLLFEG